jgi:O-succinylbenzoic acid--CoA ligase
MILEPRFSTSYLEEYRRQDFLKSAIPKPVAFSPLLLSLDLASLALLFQTLSAGKVPVLMHPYWNDNIRSEVIASISKWYIPSEPAVVVFTSGTTGKSKACLLPISRLILNAEMSNQNIKLCEEDEWILNLPLFHVGGLGIVFRTWISGARLTLSETAQTTHQSLVPTQLYRMLPNLPRRKVFLIGGGRLSSTVLDQCLSLGAPLYKTYGMTEAASQITTTRPGAGLDQLNGLSGFPLQGVELKFKDQRIHVKSPSLMTGYLGEPPIDEWHVTADLGRMTDNGIEVIGRWDRAFKSAGELIQPENIEKELLNLPGVLQAHVEGIKDNEFENIVCAYVDAQCSLEEIEERSKEHLKGLFRPKIFKKWSERTFRSAKENF